MKKISSWLLCALMVAFALPMVIILVLSFMQENTFSISQYNALISNKSLLARFGNSTIISLGTLSLQIPLSICGGVFLARSKSWLKRISLVTLLAMLLLPFQSYMLPVFLLYRQIGFYNTHIGLILIGAFSPVGPLVVYAFMRTIPEEQWEAAYLDTSSFLHILVTVILPQMRSALLMLIIIAFAEAWNMVEPAIILIANDKLLPISTSLNDLQAVSWAGAAAYCLPIVVMYGVVCLSIHSDLSKR